MEKLIAAISLKKEYIAGGGVSNPVKSLKAVDDVSFEILDNEALGLIGGRGSGKTAVGEIVAGLSLPDSGQIKFRGEDIAMFRGKKRKKFHGRVQIVFQEIEDHVDKRLTIGEIIAESIANCNKIQNIPKPMEAFEAMNLAGLDLAAADCRIGELDMLDVKRTGIALAALWRPDLIVLDEPSGKVNASSRGQLVHTLKRIRKEQGTSYLFLSRDLNVAKKICDRLAIVCDGRIVEAGSSDKIIENPESEYAKEFLASIL